MHIVCCVCVGVYVVVELSCGGSRSGDGGLVSVDAEQSVSDALTTLRLNGVHRLIVMDSLTGNPLYTLTYRRCLAAALQHAVS